MTKNHIVLERYFFSFSNCNAIWTMKRFLIMGSEVTGNFTEVVKSRWLTSAQTGLLKMWVFYLHNSIQITFWDQGPLLILSVVKFKKTKIVFQLISFSTFVLHIVSAKETNDCTPGSHLTPSGKNVHPVRLAHFNQNSGATGCISCPKGSVTPEKDASSCSLCEDSEASSRDRTACHCARGYDFNYRTRKCKTCPPGTADLSDQGYSSCESCEPGFYQPNKGATECLLCPAGSVSG